MLELHSADEQGQESDLTRGLGAPGGFETATRELPGAAYKSATSPFAGLSLASAGFPTAGAALAAAPALTELARHKGVGLTPRELLAKEKSAGKETYFENPFTQAQEWINEKVRKGKTPEERAKAEETQSVLSTLLDLALPGAAQKAFGAKGGRAISPDEILPPEVKPPARPGQVTGAAPKALTHKPGKPPSGGSPPSGGAPTVAKPSGATHAYDVPGAMRGSDPAGGLYRGVFDALEKGKTTFAGVKDPLIAKAKPFYDQGLIKTSDDIRTLVNEGPGALKSKYAPTVAKPSMPSRTKEMPKMSKEALDLLSAQSQVEKPSIKGKVTEAPETATEKRIERIRPEQRIYPRLQNVELREQQLKNHSKYVQEMETDAAERAARAEARVPKTVKGMDSQRIRIHEAEKQWPVTQEAYNKAAGRVRALEDEVVKLKGPARESAETLLEMAKKELDDATFDLKQAWENLEGTNYRATVQEMRDAARKKIQDIQDAIAEGVEYNIHKRDYSPDLITKANAISKSKKLPSARTSDFYTQVHDEYANEYRNRVAQIDNELKGVAKTPAGMYEARNLQKEKDILNKMIKSAEAEKTIQNRRFGLREMAERHKAQERFKQLKQEGGKQEVTKVAQERMWKERIEKAKTPEERGSVVDEAVEQIANEHPQQAERIRAEGQKLKDSIEDLFAPRESKAPPSVKGERTQIGGGHKKPPPPPPKPPGAPGGEPPPKGPGKGIPTEEELANSSSKDTVKKGKNLFEKYVEDIKELKENFPYIWRSKIGQDVIVGAATATWDEFRKGEDYDIPITGAQMASIGLGHPRGSPLRVATNTFVKWLYKQGRIAGASEALRKKDSVKFNSYSPSVKKTAKHRVYGS